MSCIAKLFVYLLSLQQIHSGLTFVIPSLSDTPISTTFLCTQSQSSSTTPSNNIHNLNHNNNNPQISIIQVKSQQDIIALADLRYNEWIASTDDNDNDTSSPISRHAFRMATAEIQHERSEGGAMAFLAYLKNTSTSTSTSTNRPIVVGAAELSPMEFEHTTRVESQSPLDNDNNDDNDIKIPDNTLLYVTDVVTSQTYRRMGIGETLMKAMEQKAQSLQTQYLFLHVEPDNVPALTFYQNPKLGYTPIPIPIPMSSISTNNFDEKKGIVSLSRSRSQSRTRQTTTTSENRMENEDEEVEQEIIYLDIHRLAENAGTKGQILLFKELEIIDVDVDIDVDIDAPISFDDSVPIQTKTGANTSTRNNSGSGGSGGGGGGFGSVSSGKKKTRSKKKKK